MTLAELLMKFKNKQRKIPELHPSSKEQNGGERVQEYGKLAILWVILPGVVSYGEKKKRYLTLKQKETKSKQNLAQTRNNEART